MGFAWKRLTKQLTAILEDEISQGNECACQLCIAHRREIVVDIAVGSSGTYPSGSPITPETLFPLFSAGKAVLSALTWKLAEQKIISYDTKVSSLWKEFDTADKKDITVEHLLSHRAGMYLLPPGKPDLTDWEGMCRLIAAMSPRHTPGAKCHYHPLTFAWLLGHTLELAAATPLPRLIKEEILKPLKLENDLFFGIDDDNMRRLVPVDDHLMPTRPAWEAVIMNDPKIQRCCIPSFGGIGNARGLVNFYRQLRGGLVSEKTFDHATGRLFRSPEDPVRVNEWSKFALGMILPGYPEHPRMFCGHSGAAGTEAFYMPEYDIAFAFVKNCLSPIHPIHPVRNRISRLLQVPERIW